MDSDFRPGDSAQHGADANESRDHKGRYQFHQMGPMLNMFAHFWTRRVDSE